MSHSVDTPTTSGAGEDRNRPTSSTVDNRTGSSTQGDLFRTGADQQTGYTRRAPADTDTDESGRAPEKKSHTVLIVTSVVGAFGLVAAGVTTWLVIGGPSEPEGAKPPKGRDACAQPNVHVPEGFSQYRDYNAANIIGPLNSNGYEIMGDEKADEANPKEWVAISWKDTMQTLGGYGVVFRDMRTGEVWMANLDPTQLVADADGNMTVYVPVGPNSQKIMVYTTENPYRYPFGPATNQSFSRFTVGSTSPAAIAAAGQGAGDKCVVGAGEVDKTSNLPGGGSLPGLGDGANPNSGSGNNPTGDEGNVGPGSYSRKIDLPTSMGSLVGVRVTVTA